MVSIRTILNILTCGIALLGFVPLYPYLENLPRLVFAMSLLWTVIADRGRYRVPAWVSTVASVLFFIFYAVQFSRDNLVGPAVNLLVVLLAVRLSSEKIARNYLQVFALSLFTLTSSSLFNLSPVFIVYLFLILVLIAVSLVFLTYLTASADPLVSRRGMNRILTVSLIMPVAALPLMLLFFFILPRTQFPLWNFLDKSSAATSTGLSEKVEPGSAAAVGEVRKVAFRANCEKLPKTRLYWRGIVLNAFDGHAWVRKEPPHGEAGAMIKGKTVRQTIYPEPGRTTYLVGLNVPRVISGLRFSSADDYTYMARGGGVGRIKYDVISIESDEIVPRRSVDRNFYLELSGSESRRLVELAKRIGGKAKSDEEKVSLLEGEFLARKLTYATANLPVGTLPLDEFLFEKKRGHCEFFASTFAVLLRLAGVPARLVGGYLGGEYSDIGGYYLVTDDMAHVWVEAYIQGKGWVMIDPSRWAVNFPGARELDQKSFARRVRLTLDAFSYYWNAAVVNYDLEKQVRLINGANIGLRHLSPRTFLSLFLYVVIIPFLAAVVMITLRRWRKASAEERILSKFLVKVAKEYRIKISPETGLHELADSLDDPTVSRFVDVYGNAVYHDRKLEPSEIRELKALVRGLAVPGRQTKTP